MRPVCRWRKRTQHDLGGCGDSGARQGGCSQDLPKPEGLGFRAVICRVLGFGSGKQDVGLFISILGHGFAVLWWFCR